MTQDRQSTGTWVGVGDLRIALSIELPATTVEGSGLEDRSSHEQESRPGHEQG
jgi:hypothetical protein